MILLFNYQGRWILTNRRRSDLVQSSHAVILFNGQMSGSLSDLDPSLTYLFESTVHYDYNVINYTQNRLVLLCAVGKASMVVHLPDALFPGFDRVRHLEALDIDHKPAYSGAEGCVHHLGNQYMIKAKTDWYREVVLDRSGIRGQ